MTKGNLTKLDSRDASGSCENGARDMGRQGVAVLLQPGGVIESTKEIIDMEARHG